MTINKYATRAGREFEVKCMDYLREQGFDVEQLHLRGREDEGDLSVRAPIGRYIVECKREKGFGLGGWVKEAQLERAQFAEHRKLEPLNIGWVVIHHRRGHSVKDAYVTTTVNEWVRRIS